MLHEHMFTNLWSLCSYVRHFSKRFGSYANEDAFEDIWSLESYVRYVHNTFGTYARGGHIQGSPLFAELSQTFS